MSELFIMRWPRNVSAVYVHGATVRYNKDQSVYYANEVLSPGQIICTWQSSTDYLSSGNAPTLPLLRANKQYELDIKLEADNDLPIQVQINFFDDYHEKIHSHSSAAHRFNFKIPNGTASYEINIVNLKHRWICFDYFFIGEVQDQELMIEKQFRQHYDWIYVHPLGREKSKEIRLVVNKGPRSIIPISLQLDINYEQIFVYTNGQNLDELIKSLNNAFQSIRDHQLMIEAGMGFHTLPSEVIQKIKMGLSLPAKK